eukprot:3113862-Karenia_brevis.AAC.1
MPKKAFTRHLPDTSGTPPGVICTPECLKVTQADCKKIGQREGIHSRRIPFVQKQLRCSAAM